MTTIPSPGAEKTSESQLSHKLELITQYSQELLNELEDALCLLSKNPEYRTLISWELIKDRAEGIKYLSEALPDN